MFYNPVVELRVVLGTPSRITVSSKRLSNRLICGREPAFRYPLKKLPKFQQHPHSPNYHPFGQFKHLFALVRIGNKQQRNNTLNTHVQT